MEWSDMKTLQLIELYKRGLIYMQLDNRSICNFITRLCCTLTRENCRCDIGLRLLDLDNFGNKNRE